MNVKYKLLNPISSAPEIANEGDAGFDLKATSVTYPSEGTGLFTEVCTGIAFEIPVATFLLIRAGIVQKETLVKARPYLIILFFVIGMLLTPPDIFSQLFLALPMWLLFEVGLLISREK